MHSVQPKASRSRCHAEAGKKCSRGARFAAHEGKHNEEDEDEETEEVPWHHFDGPNAFWQRATQHTAQVCQGPIPKLQKASNVFATPLCTSPLGPHSEPILGSNAKFQYCEYQMHLETRRKLHNSCPERPESTIHVSFG
jgi:hypothetical protein